MIPPYVYICLKADRLNAKYVIDENVLENAETPMRLRDREHNTY
jgi:hypothetical protein